ncbi:MAG: type I-E CRISPR-associated protein Cse1/CasA, partial [Bdellovibrionales bacterium]|nr:type I-E CRISPR-associated protein Cse1/CasA [Bdellovibrionales bacterium]
MSENFNLLEEKWIPVKRQSGAEEWIRPAQIVEGQKDDPIVRFNAPRPDFNTGFLQFMVCLLQTCCAPTTPREWRKWFDQAPTVEELDRLFEPDKDAFNLLGDGPRFMQDLERKESWEVCSVSALLVDLPGSQGLKNNTDHFAHRVVDLGLSLPAVALAIFNLQQNSPSGGRGHRTSARGGAPLSVIPVFRGDIWLTSWACVSEKQLAPSTIRNRPFPWLYQCRNSRGGRKLVANECSIWEVLWACPRRIVLMPSATGVCSIFGNIPFPVVKNVYIEAYGNNYDSSDWKHPHSAYYTKDEIQLPYNPRSGQLGFRNWHHLTYGGKSVNPSRAVADALIRLARMGAEIQTLSFGFEMSNAKVLSWRYRELPFFCCEKETQNSIRAVSDLLVSWSEVAFKELTKVLQVSLSVSMIPKEYSDEFWRKLDPEFF